MFPQAHAKECNAEAGMVASRKALVMISTAFLIESFHLHLVHHRDVENHSLKQSQQAQVAASCVGRRRLIIATRAARCRLLLFVVL